jgi:hypothetical protein
LNIFHAVLARQGAFLSALEQKLPWLGMNPGASERDYEIPAANGFRPQ